MIDKELLDILVCPKCKKGVRVEKSGAFIICDECRLAYPLWDKVPIMLIDSALPLDDVEKK